MYQDILEVIHGHIAKTPVSPSVIDPHIPQILSDIVTKLLAKTPEERYPTAGDFYRALEEAYFSAGVDLPTLVVPPEPLTSGFAGEASAAHDSPPLAAAPGAAVAPRGWGTTRLRRVPLLVLAIALLAAVIGFGVYGRQGPGIGGALQMAVTRLLGGAPAPLQSIPADVEVALELLYDADRFALHNLTAYPVPLDGLTLEWRDYTLPGIAFNGPLPPRQCSWVRLLSNGRLRPPEGCPTMAYHLRLLDSPADLFWVGRGDFTVRYNGTSLVTCPAEAGRCRFVLPR